MIKTRIDEMLSLVRDNKILSESAFAAVQLKKALHLRDFDSQYRYYHDNEIYQRWKILPIHPDIRGVFNELHDTVQAITNERARKFSNADDDTTNLILSDRITQEIDYIAMCRATEFYTDWYDQLWACYERDQIPMIVAQPLIKPLIDQKNAG